MLPNLSNVCQKCNKEVAPTGVTKQDFNVLLPGNTLKEGVTELDFLDSEDLECSICSYFLAGPAGGFKVEEGDDQVMVDAQATYNALSWSDTESARPEYYKKVVQASKVLRQSNPRRTELELLNPGCLHQFHRVCLAKWTTGSGLFQKRKKCPKCSVDIDSTILDSLKGSLPAGTSRRREEEEEEVIFVSQEEVENLQPIRHDFREYISEVQDIQITFRRVLAGDRRFERYDTINEYYLFISSEGMRLFEYVAYSTRDAIHHYLTLQAFPSIGSPDFVLWDGVIAKTYLLYRFFQYYVARAEPGSPVVRLVSMLKHDVYNLHPTNWAVSALLPEEDGYVLGTEWSVFNNQDGTDPTSGNLSDDSDYPIVLAKRAVVGFADQSLRGRLNELFDRMYSMYTRGIWWKDTGYDMYTWLTLVMDAITEFEENNNLVYIQTLADLKREFFQLLFYDLRVSTEIEASREPENLRQIFTDLSALTDEVIALITVEG